MTSLLPDDCVLGRLVFGLSLHADELDPGSVQWRRDPNLNLLSKERRLKVGLDDHLDL